MRKRGLWRDAWQRLRRNRAAVVSLIVLAMLAMAALFGPALSPYAYDALDWRALAVPPGEGTHWLGTDRLGRDLLVRTLHGTRISIAIALLATTVSVLIGVGWGAVAGYVGGRLDALMMRIVDALYSLPYIFFVIVLTVLFGRSVVLLFIAIGAVGWLTMARIVRGQTLSLRHKEFIEAAVVSGATTGHILARHVVPNVLGTVIVYASLIIPQMILFESFLSFLGLGVQEPLASLGSLVAQGAAEMESASWMLIVPAATLVILLACFNFLGDGLRDALDPRTG
ncbi:MAG TPA: ABC transporter permease subunit [Steroidobacteraceae bacterium]|nr:ABC transporter permease subunit [Steroidobacteraceae bacterium]